MSLISQNAVPKNTARKTKRDGTDDGSDNRQESTAAADDDIQRTKKRKKDTEADRAQEKEMKRLENFLFGSLYAPVEFGKGGDLESHDDGDDAIAVVAAAAAEEGPALFFTDKSGNRAAYDVDGDGDASEAHEVDEEEESKGRKPVWVDEEEREARVDISRVNRLRKLRKDEDESLISGSAYVSRLRAHHVKLNPGTEWAQLDKPTRGYASSDEDSDGDTVGAVVARGYRDTEEDLEDILRTNEDLVVKSSTKLLPGNLEYTKVVDANVHNPSSGPINSVQFHRNGQLLLTGGLDRRLSFFQIDGKRNTQIQSVFLDDCPIMKASFLPDGSQVIISGRRKFFYTLDLVKAEVDKIGPLVGREEKSLETFEVSPDCSKIAFVGNEGYILLVSAKTKELIGTLKMNGTARSLAFADDGQKLLSSGGDGHVYHWDLRTRACFHKGVDEGCINGTALCTSPGGALFAAGSASGIVNIYNREEFLGGKRKPLKVIENLTTEVDFMKFNNDAQILAISSRMKKNSLKLVHIPSFTVFTNWPPPYQPVYYPRTLDFSPGGGFMAVGNAAGKVLLYKLHHYHHA